MEERLFCKGYTWGFFAGSGTFQTPEAEYSMERLAEDGLDWICIPVNCFQESYYSLNVFSMFGRTQTDEDVVFAIKKAKSLGLKVCLKPMVDCLDHAWRARINFPGENPMYWERWFRSYTHFMLHYARLAERYECEMLCTGCEMAGMDMQTEYCLKLIEDVRKVYSGIIMHNVNHGDEMRSPWLGAVDVIGVSAYYPCSTENDNSLEHMKKVFNGVADMLEGVHKRFERPIMFAEIGVRNVHGCTQYPWDFKHRPDTPTDDEEQASFYEAALSCSFDKPWFAGYFWWDWKAVLPPIDKARENRDFTIYEKPAEQVLKKWYAK
ncbi:MAG: hypothetical protein LUI06_03420 [Ruminococcus sp.]|nr:hypothetical protein [Ruminococcus sp.]